MLKKFNKSAFSRLTIKQVLITVIIILILVIISVPLFKNLSSRYQLNQEIKNLQNQIDIVEKGNLELSKMIQYFETDSYVEEQARSNLNLKKEGEEMVVIKNKDSQEQNKINGSSVLSNGNAPMNIKVSTAPNFIKWKNYFFD